MAKKKNPHAGVVGLSALDLAEAIAKGSVRAVEATEAFLAHIGEQDTRIQAWAHLDPQFALAQAKALDRHREKGHPLGPLHGVPVGIKDIVDVAGLPCENGTPLDAGRRPRKDAAIVTRLREAGAVILGKTVTTELAVFHPGKTRNPHDTSRTPGGSSSGSAAAVAAGMAPLSVGSQTNGSVIRPAAYCGVVGFKPSQGVVSRRGVITQSPTLDTLGGFARTVEDVALLHDAMAGYDEEDRAMRLVARPQLLETARSKPPVQPDFAFVRSPFWEDTEPDLRQGYEELVAELGPRVEQVELPEVFGKAIDLHSTIHLADIAKNYGRYYDKDREQLSPRLREMVEEGRKILAMDYVSAHDWIEVYNAALDQLLDQYDALITPATTGQAPGIETTGKPTFCTLWTFCGVPAVSLPLLVGAEGLPIGVQLIGKRGRDGRLLRTARWLVERLRDESDNQEQRRG